jgi:methylated-DNA-[protein]-cysteine S-methyltransferase
MPQNGQRRRVSPDWRDIGSSAPAQVPLPKRSPPIHVRLARTTGIRREDVSMTSLHYRIIATPVGRALAVAGPDGLVALEVGDEPPEFALARLGVVLGEFPVPAAGDDLADVAEQFDAYFDGERQRFDLDLDWRLVQGFTRAALEAICEVPYGETASYGEVAVLAGAPRAARAVGTACARTPFSIVVPVHRVVRADGSIGEYGGRPDIKRFLIELERETLALES